MPQIYGACPVPIEKLLLRWQKVLALATAQMRQYDRDLPYWHNERANVGFVAQAARELGCVVLEEYTVDRGRRKKSAPGRADLWTGDPSRVEHEFEFKLHWPSIKSSTEALDRRIRKDLAKAESQLRTIQHKPGRAPSLVAMVLVCPSIAESDQPRWKPLLNRFLERVTRPQDYGGTFSAVFVPSAQPRAADDGYLYPAIAVFGRMV